MAVAAPAADVPATAAIPTSQAQQWEPALLRVTVNGQDKGEPIALLRRSNHLLIPRTAWTAWRLDAPAAAATTVAGVQYLALDEVKGVRFDVDEPTQTLAVAVAPELFGTTKFALSDRQTEPMTANQTGGFLNYDVLADHSLGRTSVNAALELGIFTRRGVGLSTFVGTWDDRRTALTRLDTSWTIDDPGRRRTLRLGDAISGGGTGGTPVRFGGIQFASNFTVEPGFVTQPVPTLKGSAALPSVVDVYVNKNLAGSRTVAPGPFSIQDVPAVTGGGNVQLVVRDALGRETLVTQSYYSTPQMLRPGLSAFSYELGFLRRNYALNGSDYGPLMASATHRVGLSDALTGELHAEATRTVQQAGASATMLLGSFGAVSLAGAASKGPDGGGMLAGATFERRTSHLSIGASAQYTTTDFTSIGFDRGYSLGRMNVQSFIGMPVSFGSFGLSYTLRQRRRGSDINIVSANATVRLPRIGSLHLSARKSLDTRGATAFQLFFTLPFRGRTSVSSSAQYEAGRASVGANIQRSISAGEGLGYRASISAGEFARMDGAVTLQTATGTYQVQAARVDGRAGVRAEAQGGLGLVGRDLFAARSLSQSFAVVHVGDYRGVRVYADNQLVGKTDAAGMVVVPRLRPFDRNSVRIDLADLPLDARFAASEQVVRPYNRAGLFVNFDARRERSATLTVRLEDGTALPDGTTVQVQGTPGDYVSAPGGEVYLSGLSDSNIVVAQWGDRSCRFTLDLPHSDGVQPDLGSFTCKAVAA